MLTTVTPSGASSLTRRPDESDTEFATRLDSFVARLATNTIVSVTGVEAPGYGNGQVVTAEGKYMELARNKLLFTCASRLFGATGLESIRVVPTQIAFQRAENEPEVLWGPRLARALSDLEIGTLVEVTFQFHRWEEWRVTQETGELKRGPVPGNPRVLVENVHVNGENGEIHCDRILKIRVLTSGEAETYCQRQQRTTQERTDLR